MKTIKIKIKPEHIETGMRADEKFCPIALAADDAGLLCPEVNCIDMSVGIKDKKSCIAMPKKAQKFVSDFDNGDPVKPFQFTVRVPDKALNKSKLYPCGPVTKNK